MASVRAGDDQIGGLLIVELVDLVTAVHDRHVPFQEIDEDSFARLEHRSKRREARGIGNVVGKGDHVSLRLDDMIELGRAGPRPLCPEMGIVSA
jgi:hypothetical protein